MTGDRYQEWVVDCGYRNEGSRDDAIMIRLVLFVIVILLLIGSLPAWPYSAGWGLLPERRPGHAPDCTPDSRCYRRHINQTWYLRYGFDPELKAQ